MDKPNPVSNQIKIIDNIIKAYKRKKLQLKSLDLQQQQFKLKEGILFETLRNRISKAYKKLKRQQKIDKLQNNSQHWKGLS